jgi:GNAT superfamily N-acetyltransferase
VAPVTELRPLRDEDVPAAHEVMVAAFADLNRRFYHEEPQPGRDPSLGHVRFRRILDTDPDGCWVADDGDGVTGVALAIVRDGVWGLSLLVVRPELQSTGIGRALLDRTLEYGAGARGGIVLASPDARALRSYARAGFALHPTLNAIGAPVGAVGCADVRPWEPGDHELAEAVDRAVRGARHGADLDALAAGGAELLTLPGRGYAAHLDYEVKTIAAFDDGAAAALLRSVLARVPEGRTAAVEWIGAPQQWAIDVAVAMRLELAPGGAIALRGEVGPFRPYLPGGAYL